MKKAVSFFLQGMIWCAVGAQPARPATAGLPARPKMVISNTGWMGYSVDTALATLAKENSDARQDPDALGQLQELLPATVYSEHGDTISLLIGGPPQSGPCLHLLIAGDSCTMYYLAPGDGVPIPPSTCRLTLSRRPDPATGGPVCGKIEFDGAPLHGKDAGDGTDSRYVVYGPFRAQEIKK